MAVDFTDFGLSQERDELAGLWRAEFWSDKGFCDLFLARGLGLFDVASQHLAGLLAMLFYALNSGIDGNGAIFDKRLNIVICLGEGKQLIDCGAALADQCGDLIW